MIRRSRPLSAFLLACALSPLAAQTVERWELPGGLPLVVAERHATPLVALCLAVRAGTLQEGELAGSGAAGLAAHLLTPPAELAGLGATWQVRVGVGSATITVLTTSGNEDEALRLLLASVGAARFTNDDIARWRARQPAGEDAVAALIGLLDPTSAARWPVDGLPGARAARQPDALDLNAWFRARWRSGNAVLAVAGNVHAPVVHAVAERTAALPPGGVVGTVPSVGRPERDRRRAFATTGEPRVALAWAMPAPGQADHAAALALVHELRLRLGDAAEVALRHDGAAPAVLVVTVPVGDATPAAQEARVQEAVRLAGSEAALAATAIRLARAEAATIAGDAGALAQAIAETDLLTADAGAWPRLHAAVEALTPADLARVAAVWLHDAHHATLTLTSPADAPAAWDGAPLAGTAAPPVLVRGASGLRVVVRGGLDQGLSAVCLRLGGDGGDPEALACIARAAVRATRFQTPEDLAARCADAGLSLSGRVADGGIEFGITCLPESVDRAVDLVLEIAAEAALPPDELAHCRPEPASGLVPVVRRALHPGPAAAPVRAACWPRWQRLAVAGNATLAVYGPAEAAALLRRAEARLPAGAPPPVAPAPPLPGGLLSCTWNAPGDGVALLWELPELTPAPAAVFDRLVAQQGAALGLTVWREGRRLLVGGQTTGLTPEAIAARMRAALAVDAAALGPVRAACLTAWAEARQDAARTAAEDAGSGDPLADARRPEALRAVTPTDLGPAALALAGEPTVVVLHPAEPNR